jgi:hypothetical protein
VQTQVTDIAKCERKGHLPQWKIHLARRGLPLSQPGLRSLDNHIVFVAEHLTRTESETESSREGTRQNQQILASSLNNKRVRASRTFGILAIRIKSIDCKYLRRNGVNASTQCREQIRQGISHLLKHRRSSRRRRNIDKPPSRKRIMQKTLFTQRQVRLQSTKGRHLLSP